MIKNAIDADATLSKMTIEVFVQGSYANNTNVRLNSDVDICIRNMDYLFCEYPEGKADSDFGIIGTEYGVIPFLVEIEVWLPPWDNPRDDIS
jgi:predicted nucleotidyltransferase